MSYRLRTATLEDRAALEALIARSARELSTGDYTPEQVEGALRGAFGVDTQLIVDGTYFVIESAGQIVGCGGWSYRRTMFGSDAGAERDASELDPAVDAAKIRAFFIDPSYTRRGLGTLLLNKCESEAVARGFSHVEMMATLPGRKLYAARGYSPVGQVSYALAPGLNIDFVPMRKALLARSESPDSDP
jgi:GNAT superfamily N-acetyltransferase